MAQVLAAPGRSGARKQGLGKFKSKPPVLKTTRYDIVSAFMIAVVVAMIILVVWVTALWLANRRVIPDNEIPIEMVSLGGDPKGAPDSTLKVESPEDPTDDPSNVDRPDQETELEKVIESVVEPSDTAVQQLQKNEATALSGGGKIGSKDGTGKPPLGDGPGDGGGTSTERWFIRFADKGTLDVYARQLDYFGIELGLVDRKARVVHLLKNLSRSKATHTILRDTSKKAKTVNFAWAGGKRKKADLDLFRKNGINLRDGGIYHFYPPTSVNMLIDREKKAMREGKTISQIKRTYFVVRSKGGGFEFVVTQIKYK